MEAILADQLKIYLGQNILLSPVQSGFRSGYRCKTTLLDITDNIIKFTDQN